jgi:hypothetical protein
MSATRRRDITSISTKSWRWMNTSLKAVLHYPRRMTGWESDCLSWRRNAVHFNALSESSKKNETSTRATAEIRENRGIIVLILTQLKWATTTSF